MLKLSMASIADMLLRHPEFLLPLFACLASFASCRCQTPNRAGSPENKAELEAFKALAANFDLDETQALKDLNAFTEAPHPFGSPRQESYAQSLKARLEEQGLATRFHNFSSEVPVDFETLTADPDAPKTKTLSGINLLAFRKAKARRDCVILIGSHYDTKEFRDFRFVGANDGGSSTVALLQLFHYLDAKGVGLDVANPLDCQLAAVFFDGEEAQLPKWNDGLLHPARIVDHTYGSRALAAELKPCTAAEGKRRCLDSPDGSSLAVEGLILLDMIGSDPFLLSLDPNSSKPFLELLKAAAAHFGQEAALVEEPRGVSDDHLSFIEVGIPAIDLINFKDLSHWHNDSDTLENLSLASIEKSTRIALYLAFHVSADPQLLSD